MALNKKKKADHVELPDNWIAVPSKSYSNRTYYYNKITKKTTWENPMKNIQKNKNCEKIPQISQTDVSSKKRKSVDNNENNLAESSSETELNTNKLPGTKSDYVHTRGVDVKANRTSKRNKGSTSSIGSKKITLNETGLHSIKSEHSSTLDEKWNVVRTAIKSSINKEIGKKVEVVSERVKEKRPKGSEEKNKTLAQCRLIKKRKQIEVAAKKALASLGLDKGSTLLMDLEKQGTVKIVHSTERNYTNSNSHSPVSCTPVVTRAVSDRVRKFVRQSREKAVYSSVDASINSMSDENSKYLDEEMDWEPSDQEVMIEHIKTMRRNRGTVEELSNDIAMCSKNDIEIKQDENNLILVFDTNVFISCLPFIKEIRDTWVPGFGLPRIFIPWRVLQELDHLKKSDIKPLQVSAIRAIRFLNENFSCRHPRVSGQSYEEFSSLSEGSSSCPDDDILEICLNIKRREQSRMVMLITNDKNLESKAIVSGVEAFSKDRFMKDKLSDTNGRVSKLNTNSKARNIALKSDMGYCRLKGALKKFLGQLLETEFMNAFNNDWKKIVTKKPPWMLMDMFECFIKHWRSVFTLIFKMDVLALVEDLREQFVKVEKGENVIVADIAQISKDLLTKMRGFVNHEKPYWKILSDTITEVEMWIGSKNASVIENSEETDNIVSWTNMPSSSHEPPMICNAQSPPFDISLCRDKVKNLFQMIWDQVKSFLVSELAAANGIGNPDALREVKSQFPHVIRNVHELIEIVEKILSLRPEDSSQANQIILHFTNFLVGLNVFQIDATELNNLPGYIGLFCSDNDGRMILCTFVNDLKQFAMGIMEGMKVLERL